MFPQAQLWQLNKMLSDNPKLANSHSRAAFSLKAESNLSMKEKDTKETKEKEGWRKRLDEKHKVFTGGGWEGSKDGGKDDVRWLSSIDGTVYTTCTIVLHQGGCLSVIGLQPRAQRHLIIITTTNQRLPGHLKAQTDRRIFRPVHESRTWGTVNSLVWSWTSVTQWRTSFYLAWKLLCTSFVSGRTHNKFTWNHMNKSVSKIPLI